MAGDRFPGPEWYMLAFLCLVAFLAFAQAIPYELVYDDDLQVLRNPWIRDWSQVGRFFTTDVWRFSATEGVSNYYRPLHMVAHAVGFSLSGMKPYGYHLISILLHCACTLLVTLFGFRLTRDRLTGAAGGLIFALHPIHAESVAWVAGVPDPLCSVFYFGALLVHLTEDEGKPARTDAMTAALFLGALFSKEMAFTLPVVTVWMDWCLGRRLRWRRYAVLMITFAVYAALRITALGQFLVEQVPLNLSVHDRLLSSVVLMAQYVVKSFFPFDINAYHVFTPTITVFDRRFVLSAMALLVFAVGAWRLRVDRRILFLFGFILLTLLPVMNITGLGQAVFADRYLYLPSLGSCLLIPLIAREAWRLRPLNLRWSGEMVACCSLAALILSFALVLRNTTYMWRNNLTLCTETLKRSPDAAGMAANLARYYFNNSQTDQAEYWLLRAQEMWECSLIKSRRTIVDNYVRLSAISLQRGNPSLALEHLQKGYAADPRDPNVLQGIGSVYVTIKDYAQARKWLEAALAVNPRNEVSYNNLAFVFLMGGEYDQTIEYAQKAIEILPQFGSAYLNLARAYAAKGLARQAREAYLNAKKSEPSLASAVDEELRAFDAAPQAR